MWEGEARGVATFWYPPFLFSFSTFRTPFVCISFFFYLDSLLSPRVELSSVWWATEPQCGPKCASILLQFKTLIRNRLQIVCARKQQQQQHDRSNPRVPKGAAPAAAGGGEGGNTHCTPYTVRRRATKCVHINFIYLHRVGKAIAAGRCSGRRRRQRERGRHTDDDDEEEADLTIQTGCCCCCCCWWSNLATIVVVVVVVPVVVGGAVGFSKALTCETWDWDWAWAWSTPGRSIDLDNELL